MLEPIAQCFKRLAVNIHVICSVFKELCVTCSTASFDVIASSQEVILPESFLKVNTFVQLFLISAKCFFSSRPKAAVGLITFEAKAALGLL
jgi:hypothetical protein